MIANSQQAIRKGDVMIVTPEQFDSLLVAAKPLIQWLNENGHPHCTAIVDQVSVELTESVATNRTEEFLRD